jgi:hypothetical protein
MEVIAKKASVAVALPNSNQLVIMTGCMVQNFLRATGGYRDKLIQSIADVAPVFVCEEFARVSSPTTRACRARIVMTTQARNTLGRLRSIKNAPLVRFGLP